jgi:hypothetical protein
MAAANRQQVVRLVSQNITDSEVNTDNNKYRILFVTRGKRMNEF